MNTMLLLLGLTILYYLILFYVDNKRRKAFKLFQKNAIAATTPLPSMEKVDTADLFGSTEIAATQTATFQLIEPDPIRTMLELEDKHLEKELEELAMDLEAEQSYETANNHLIGALAAQAKEDINDEDISNIVATISQRKI